MNETQGSEDQADMASWPAEAVFHLLNLQNADGGWGYADGAASATEPTALVMLALTATPPDDASLSAGIRWLGERQREDGMFTASAGLDEASWTTPLAGLTLAALGQSAPSQAAAQALLALPVFTFDSRLMRGVYGFDASIPGWPWTPGDFSFVEPTALSVVFLKQTGHGHEPRVRQAADLLRDRALADGGWNYGEPQVLGGDLYPAAVPTAMAILALADEQDDRTQSAVDWLQAQRGQPGALFSLGWAAAALNVLGMLDELWQMDVATTWRSLPAQRRGPLETSLCLLGLTESTDHPLSVL